MSLARSYSRPSARAGIVVAGVTFVLGIATGTVIGPALSGLPVPANAAPGVAQVSAATTDARAGQPAEVLRVLDGDTFEAKVHVWPGIDITTKIRLRSIDAPEMRARCPDERVKAETAREALRAMLAEGDVMVTRVGIDKYGGRVLANAGSRGTPDVSAALLARGLVRPYTGGRRESWCDGT